MPPKHSTDTLERTPPPRHYRHRKNKLLLKYPSDIPQRSPIRLLTQPKKLEINQAKQKHHQGDQHKENGGMWYHANCMGTLKIVELHLPMTPPLRV